MKFTRLMGLVTAGVALGVIALLALGGQALGNYVQELVGLQSIARAALMQDGLIVVVIFAYIALIAFPFVPGAEIGFALLMIFGAEFAGVLYLATVAALTLSFAIGRLAPIRALERMAERLGFTRTARLLTHSKVGATGLGATPADGRSAPRWINWLMKHRVIALAAMINTPGNTLIGGGGGIALVAGISRLISFRDFLIGVSIAVAPVPVFVVITAWFMV